MWIVFMLLLKMLTRMNDIEVDCIKVNSVDFDSFDSYGIGVDTVMMMMMWIVRTNMNNVQLDGIDVDGVAVVYVVLDVVCSMRSVKANTEKTAVIVSDFG
jgi:hypothetical protein